MTIGELEDARSDALALWAKIKGLRADEDCGPQTAVVLDEALDHIADTTERLENAARIRTCA